MKKETKEKNQKKQKKVTPFRRVLKAGGILLLLTGIVASFLLVWSISSLVIDAYSFDITDYKMNASSIIYLTDQEGNTQEYEQLHSDTRRVWVSINNMPEYLQKATVAIEDERFYTHQGMDLKRTGGAILGFITGHSDYGGSTITQQLVKNVTGEKETTPARKMKEIFRALVLETQFSKDEILEYYLNIVYFGNSSYGVQMASHTYFDKDVSELSLAESASVIGITQRPAAFDPFEHPDKNKEKQELVLAKMLELNFITKEEHDAAVAEKLVFTRGENEPVIQAANSYFSEALIKELANDIAASENISMEQARRMVYTGGLKIYSTVEWKVQSAMEEVFSDSTNRSLFPKLSGTVQPQAAMMVLSPDTGAVLGVVGGVGKKTDSLVLNRAVDSKRQPGSSIKPITAYGPAVELGKISPGSIIVDEPFKLGNWEPKNWYSGYKGKVTMREAVVQSMNIPAIKTVQSVGVETSFDYAKNKLGLSTLDDVNDKNLAPLALGGLTDGVTVRDLTAAYATFANKGTYTKPYYYTKVLDRKGKVLIEKKPVQRKVFSEQTAYLMTSVLKSTAEGSLGNSAKLSNMVSAAKTGTTNDDKDRWYVGYTPYYVGGVWYGYDEPKTVPYSQTRIVAHKLWKAVMEKIHKGLPSKEFTEPSGIVKVNICTITGDKAVAYSCPTVNEEFKAGSEPKKYCNTVGHSAAPPEKASPTPGTSGEPTATPKDDEQPSQTPRSSDTPQATEKPAANNTPVPRETPQVGVSGNGTRTTGNEAEP